ncbi:sigma-70 family RNA polymerase sigma factor [Emticicia sp. CRIBPO]|uniref:RNA polymerase sigma factor n=1 Tax=Emticicia sp. CRIBPO TaxID=2683258 RepID=UPI001412C23A|nr:sigma-70 family RNA polymerase sigma factor [Emticicia sp. CRIBPO]NBA89099.1 sigma-70 family RNA polymerase sigma factor [Emticicia sp. CRIBPO]
MEPASDQNLNLDELSLWKAFKAGDEVAFAEIYRLHIQGLLNYGNKISPDRQLIQDTIHDLFIELWNSRQRLNDTTSVKFYLFRALRNKIFRAGRPEMSSEEDMLQLTEPSAEFLMMENEMESDRIDRLRAAVSRLSKRQQEAINLRYFHDFSNDEVASMMGLNYQSACKLIYSGLKFLKENIKLLIIILLYFREL